MSTHAKDWIDVFGAIAPFIAAAAAAFVAVMQWILQKQQFKQSLYEKRFAIYDAAKTYLVQMMQTTGKTEIPMYQQFRAATDSAEFLFPQPVPDYITSIGKLGLDFRTTEKLLEVYEGVLRPQLIPPDPNDRRYREAVEQNPRVQEREKQHIAAVIRELEGNLKAVFRQSLTLEDNRPWYEQVEAGLDSWITATDKRLAERQKG